MHIRPGEIGGGIVQRTFTFGEKRLRRGEQLNAAEIASLPRANLQSLIDGHYLDVYPLPPATVAETVERHVVRTPGFASKTYDVIAGKRIAEGLTKEHAEALASGPTPIETSN